MPTSRKTRCRMFGTWTATATTQHTGETTCGCSRSASSNRFNSDVAVVVQVIASNHLNPIHMETRIANHNSRIGLLTAVLLAVGAPARSADTPALKDAYKDHFFVGAAVNRTIATRAAVRADNVRRTSEQVEKDIALAKDQFNQISPENDLKWALIHPREGADGNNFGPADVFVNFGLSACAGINSGLASGTECNSIRARQCA